jgi:hypothetical protein
MEETTLEAALISADSQIIPAAARQSESGCGNQISGSSWWTVLDSDAANACPPPNRPSLAPSGAHPLWLPWEPPVDGWGCVSGTISIRLGIAARAVGCPTITVFSTLLRPSAHHPAKPWDEHRRDGVGERPGRSDRPSPHRHTSRSSPSSADRWRNHRATHEVTMWGSVC